MYVVVLCVIHLKGTSLLDLLNQMVESPEVAICFCSLPLSTRVSAAVSV